MTGTQFSQQRGGRNRGRSSSNNKRGRSPGQNNGGGISHSNQNFDSNGPQVKIRGNARQIYEKYTQLARDIHGQDDRVLMETYLQYADHYYRIAAVDIAAQAERNRLRADQGRSKSEDTNENDEADHHEDEDQDEDSSEAILEVKKPENNHNNHQQYNDHNNLEDIGFHPEIGLPLNYTLSSEGSGSSSRDRNRGQSARQDYHHKNHDDGHDHKINHQANSDTIVKTIRRAPRRFASPPKITAMGLSDATGQPTLGLDVHHSDSPEAPKTRVVRKKPDLES